MYTNESVCAKWMHDKSGKSGHMYTNGQKLWSYNMLIGKTDKGMKISLDIFSLNVSRTTNQHIRLANKYSHKTVIAVCDFGKSRYYRYSFPSDAIPLLKFENGVIMSLDNIPLSTYVFQHGLIALQCLKESIRLSKGLIDPETNKFYPGAKTQELRQYALSFPILDKPEYEIVGDDEMDQHSSDKLIMLKYINDVFVIATFNRAFIWKQYPFKSKKDCRNCIRYISAFIDEKSVVDVYGNVGYFYSGDVFRMIKEYLSVDQAIQEQENYVKELEKQAEYWRNKTV